MNEAISSYNDRTSLVNTGFIIWKKNIVFSCGAQQVTNHSGGLGSSIPVHGARHKMKRSNSKPKRLILSKNRSIAIFYVSDMNTHMHVHVLIEL